MRTRKILKVGEEVLFVGNPLDARQHKLVGRVGRVVLVFTRQQNPGQVIWRCDGEDYEVRRGNLRRFS